MLDGAARAGFGSHAAQEDDLSARLEHAREFIERRFRVGNGGDDILRDDHIEGVVREIQPLGVHHLQRLDVRELRPFDALTRLAEHRFRDVDADDAIAARIIRQRNPRAHADLENASADALRRLDRSAAPALEHGSEHEIIDRRPAVIGALHGISLDFDGYGHGTSPCLQV